MCFGRSLPLPGWWCDGECLQALKDALVSSGLGLGMKAWPRPPALARAWVCCRMLQCLGRIKFSFLQDQKSSKECLDELEEELDSGHLSFFVWV